MAQPVASTQFEDAADTLLTETVKVVAANRRATRTGSVVEPATEVVTDLRCSIQPRSSFDTKTVLGWLPETTHMAYCRAEDTNAIVLDIHKADRVIETTANRKPREFVILNEPDKFPDFETGGWHHLEFQLREDVYA